MTLETLYFIAQILAALGVISSLLFVGLQIKSNTREQVLTRATEQTQHYGEFQLLLINNAEFRDIWLRGADDLESLAPSELLAFGAYLALWVGSVMRVQAQKNAGHGSDDTLETTKSMYKPITRHKGPRDWWHRARGNYNPEVRELVDSMFEGMETHDA